MSLDKFMGLEKKDRLVATFRGQSIFTIPSSKGSRSTRS
jgi:hypothetical protein